MTPPAPANVPLPASVRLEDGHGGLPVLRVESPRHGTAEVYLHGAHLTAWQPRGHDPVLFTSGQSTFAEGKPIRGGVPICFPWFGPHRHDSSAPMHGFARTRAWALAGADEGPAGIGLTFTLEDDEATRASAWASPFRASYRVVCGESLQMALTVVNTGPTAMTYEAALHTYFAVRDARRVTISGLEHTAYLDKTDGFARKTQSDSPVRVTGETDRIYLDTTATCLIEDPVLRRCVRIAKSGSRNTVVWNPWVERARAIGDLGDEEWTGMVCVETCNVGDASVTLEPGGQHVMSATIDVVKVGR